MVRMQIYEGRVCQPPTGGNITIIVARFNKTITQRLLDGAIAKLRQHKVHEDDIRVVWVPGAYELPFLADQFAKDPECMAIICLGAVIKGETSHDEHINRYVSMSLGDIAVQTGTPIIFGVITCDTIEQAEARSGIVESAKDKTRNPAPGNKGAEAAEAALEMIDLIEEIPDYRISFNPQDVLERLMGGCDCDDCNDDDDDDDDDYDMPYFPPLPHTRRKGTKKAKKSSKK